MRPQTLLATLALTLPLAAQDKITWFQGSYSDALAKAKESGQLALVYFWENEHDECSRFYGESMNHTQCIPRLGEFVCFSADVKQDAGKGLQKQLRVTTLPTILFVNGDGKLEEAIYGFTSATKLASQLKRIKSGEGTVSALAKRAQSDPKNLDTVYEYAEALRKVKNEKAYDATVATIRQADPQGKTLAGARVYLRDVLDKIVAAEKPDFRPLKGFLKRNKHKEVSFVGWREFGMAQVKHKQGDAGRTSFQKAWKLCPKDELLDFSQALTNVYWAVKDRMKKADKKLVVDVAKAQLTLSEKFKNPKAKGRPDDITDFKQFLASRVDVLTFAYWLAGKRKQAIAAANRSIKLDPTNTVYAKRLAQVKSR